MRSERWCVGPVLGVAWVAPRLFLLRRLLLLRRSLLLLFGRLLLGDAYGLELLQSSSLGLSRDGVGELDVGGIVALVRVGGLAESGEELVRVDRTTRLEHLLDATRRNGREHGLLDL